MSYCVNCGVELEASLTFCPLCNTPVINPKQLAIQKTAISPFPKEKGMVENVKRSDLSILMCTILLSTSVVCGITNFFVAKDILWCIPIIGLCALLLVFSIPFLIYTKLPISISLLFDGIITGTYLFMFTFLTSDSRWFWEVALPITVLTTLLVEIFLILFKYISSSFLPTALYFFAEIGTFCLGIETFLDGYRYGVISLFWSIIVFIISIVACVTIITVLSRQRLHNTLKRRLHF